MIPSAFRNNTILLFLKSFKTPRARTHTSKGMKGAGLEMYVQEREC